MSSKVAAQHAALEDALAPSAEARKLARYLWAAPLVSGRRVLDVRCGLGQGAAALIEAGAAEVFGVDDAEAVVEVARSATSNGVTIQHAGLSNLPFPAAEFDVAIWFDTRGREDECRGIVDELARVLKPEGLLLVSTRSAATADALRALAGQHRKQVCLLRQYDVAASFVLDDDTADGNGAAPRSQGAVRVVDGCEPGIEGELIVLASSPGVKPPPVTAVAVGARDARRWLERGEEQERVIHELKGQVRDLQAQLEERSRLRHELRVTEQALAVRIASFDVAVQEVSLTAANATAKQFRETVSWKVTGPLRRSTGGIKRLIGKGLRARL